MQLGIFAERTLIKACSDTSNETQVRALEAGLITETVFNSNLHKDTCKIGLQTGDRCFVYTPKFKETLNIEKNL